MKLLILGGTIFLGRHLVEEALRRGHEVTLFNRGVHGPDLYPELEHLHGNRYGDLAALEGRSWDAAIDTNGFVPHVVRTSARLLADKVAHYTFISSISVYASFETIGMDERAPVGKISEEQLREAEAVVPPERGTVAVAYAELYGPLKALCEQAAEEALPGRVLNVRPGLIVGPYDYSDRFSYWVRRVAQGGEVLAPGRPAYKVALIDGRDLAEWIVRMVEQQQTGIYNATGPDYLLTMGAFLEECKTVSGSDAYFSWLDEQFLLDAGVAPWSEMPLWIPESAREEAGHNALSIAKARAAGLTFRPISQTIRATLDWLKTLPADRETHAGMKPERERQLLSMWHAR